MGQNPKFTQKKVWTAPLNMLVNSLTFRQDKLQGGVPITAKDTTHANVILYLICRFVPFEIQSVEGKKGAMIILNIVIR